MPAPATWTDAKAAAMKILGDKAKLPEPKATFQKFYTEFKKADKAYDAAVAVLQDKILELQNAMAATKNSYQQYEDTISRSDFGLNPKDKEEKQKIDDAQKILSSYIDAQKEVVDENIKNLDDLDKHTMGLSKYASEKCG